VDGDDLTGRRFLGYVAALLLVCPTLLVGISVAAGAGGLRSADAMADGANRFLAALTPEQRTRTLFSIDDKERFHWGFTPRSRRGIPIKDLRPNQRRLAHDFLRSGLSQAGYRKASDVIRLESVLRELEGPFRDSELYFFSVFGKPSEGSAWGWRVEGHHLSLNFTVGAGSEVATAPSFFGANPATVEGGALAGLRALAGEEDRARELLLSLDEKQRARALFTRTAPADILTGDAEKVDPQAPAGIPARDLAPQQRERLQKLLDEYLGRMPADVAAERLERLRSEGLEKIFFAWAGGAAPAQPHYYRLQGPTFLVEYDNTQNRANHIHTVWRDFEGDFGRDLLREHYRAAAHAGS
jgi:hypothetical protein